MGGDIVVARDDDESQSELLLLLLLMSGAEMTLTVLLVAAFKLFLPMTASTSSRHVGSSLRPLDFLLLPLQFMLHSDVLICDTLYHSPIRFMGHWIMVQFCYWFRFWSVPS